MIFLKAARISYAPVLIILICFAVLKTQPAKGVHFTSLQLRCNLASRLQFPTQIKSAFQSLPQYILICKGFFTKTLKSMQEIDFLYLFQNSIMAMCGFF